MSDEINAPDALDGQIAPGSVEVTAGETGAVCIALIGEHDLGTRKDVEPPLHSATLGDDGVIVDLTRTTFLDSTILHVLVSSDATLRDRGRRLVLVVPADGVARRALEISGLAETMACCHTIEQAAELA